MRISDWSSDVCSSDLLARADDVVVGRTAAVVFNATGGPAVPGVDWLACAGDPHLYARDLYALLRRLDQQGYAHILMEQPPRSAAWQAVNDRIGRAAAAFDPL